MKLCEVDKTKLSPMMKEYAELKEKYKDVLIFYRLGDFYELFFEDAELVSHELELTLTKRAAGLEERVPMCGVPFHSVKPYIEKLINKGYKVAIVEQLEDPKNAVGMVKRGITNIYSRGTITDLELLDEKEESLICGLLDINDNYILTILDISTGKISSLKLLKNNEKLINELINRSIKEIVLENSENISLINTLKNYYNIEVDIFNKDYEENLDLFNNITDYQISSGIKHLFSYLNEMQVSDFSHITNIDIIDKRNYLEMDIHTVRNLELIETTRLKERTFSLLWLLDKCKTAMGSRKLKSWLMNPLKDKNIINERLDKIEILNKEFILKDELREYLYEIYDLERLTGKITNGSLNGRDLLQLKNSLKVLPNIKTITQKLNFKYNIEIKEDLYDLLNKSISEDAPLTIKDGGIIKEGYSKELDELKNITKNGKQFIASFESELKEKTGIKNLKIGYNKVFGYFIEVSKGNIKEIKPEFNFERRQTLTNGERYICPELKEKEHIILNAEDKIINLEYDLFIEIKEKVKQNVTYLKNIASIISEIDVLASLSVCSEAYNFVKPNITDEKKLEIIEGFHPVIASTITDTYVKNDCIMDNNKSTLLITGPNMSGKSTYMRQLAIIVIMAQMGSYVPAKSAVLPIIDKIFTRIGASDDLVSGESTFMVEMKEARNAIVNATENSLILFDELGRGTATYDGMALAKAILEYVSKDIKCFTLFSTHYHEITSLENEINNIKNIHVSAVEENNNLILLHKIKEGPVDRSYGIHVAKLALLPEKVINRASIILNEYENETKKTGTNNKNIIQLSIPFEEEKKETKLEEKIKEIDPADTTPLQALTLLYELKKLYYDENE